MSIMIFQIDRRYFIFDFSSLHEWSGHSTVVIHARDLHLHPVCVPPQLGWPWQRSQRLKSIRIIMRIINSRDYKKNARIIVLECMYIVQWRTTHACVLSDLNTTVIRRAAHLVITHLAPETTSGMEESMANVFLTWNCCAYFTYLFRLAKITTNLFLVDLLRTKLIRNDRFC